MYGELFHCIIGDYDEHYIIVQSSCSWNCSWMDYSLAVCQISTLCVRTTSGTHYTGCDKRSRSTEERNSLGSERPTHSGTEAAGSREPGTAGEPGQD